MPWGGVQVPPDGQPILLMADRQTTGGYPLVGVVISADLPRAGQLAPGDPVRFQAVTLAERTGTGRCARSGGCGWWRDGREGRYTASCESWKRR